MCWGDTDGHPETHLMSSCPVCVGESLRSRTGTCRGTLLCVPHGAVDGDRPGRAWGRSRPGGQATPTLGPCGRSAELRPTRRLPVLRPPLPVCVACFAPVGVAGTFRHRPGQRPPGSGPRDWPPRADEVTLVFPEARLRAAVSRGPGGSGVRGALGSRASRVASEDRGVSSVPVRVSPCAPAHGRAQREGPAVHPPAGALPEARGRLPDRGRAASGTAEQLVPATRLPRDRVV